jgi:hypothetical protein
MPFAAPIVWARPGPAQPPNPPRRWPGERSGRLMASTGASGHGRRRWLPRGGLDLGHLHDPAAGITVRRRAGAVLVGPTGNTELGDRVDSRSAARGLQRFLPQPRPADVVERTRDQVLRGTAQRGRLRVGVRLPELDGEGIVAGRLQIGQEPPGLVEGSERSARIQQAPGPGEVDVPVSQRALDLVGVHERLVVLADLTQRVESQTDRQDRVRPSACDSLRPTAG